jgi:putative transposase
MAWRETCVEEERFRFIEEWRRGELSFAEICRQFGVSRKTGYKWQERYAEGGWEALRDQSRAAHHHPNEVLEEVVSKVLKARAVHPTWGPVKLRVLLEREAPEIRWPAASTIGEILQRNGLTAVRKRRARATPNAAPLADALQPNEVWCADYKGWFQCQDGTRCDPLTISDASTRYLLRCQAVDGLDYRSARPIFEAAFRQYGLPVRIRSDNGTPFASVGIGGISRLSLWWIQLGIRPERIRPAQPQENGRHERMHRTLKQDTARPAKANLRLQQKAFDAFRREYNEQRPHQALGHKTPAELFSPSARQYTGRIQPFEYTSGWQVRKIGRGGNMCWAQHRVFISHVFTGEWIGLEPIADGVWKLWYRDYPLGIFSEREGKARSLPRPALQRPDKSVPHAD